MFTGVSPSPPWPHVLNLHDGSAFLAISGSRSFSLSALPELFECVVVPDMISTPHKSAHKYTLLMYSNTVFKLPVRVARSIPDTTAEGEQEVC